jgi:hypothetical protein
MFKALKEGLSPKAKALFAVGVVVFLAVSLWGGYALYDYKENNPNMCIGCHLMQSAYDKWHVSEHAGMNCHACHQLTYPEQVMLMVNLVLHNPKEVPARHGKVIVPSRLCSNCHIEKDEHFGYPDAKKITNSAFHARHYFMAQVECTKCHGYKLHEFTPDPKFCVNCHKDKNEVHGMPSLACLSCHNDRSDNLKPNRDACLICHGSEEQRAAIKKACPQDKKGCSPSDQDVAAAVKLGMTFPENGAMRFECQKCHNPHKNIKPTVEENCMPCHANVKKLGKHAMHLESGLKCFDCHRPHYWRVTKADTKQKKCSGCHGAVDPANFLK